LYKPEILKAKQRVLAEKGIAVTRRLDGLKEINKEPRKWVLEDKAYCDYKGRYVAVFFNQNTQKSLYILPPFHPGQLVYVKEAWAAMHLFDNCAPISLDPKTPIWFKDTPPDDPTNCGDDMGKWRSPLHLREVHARYFHQIIDVRPERCDFPFMSREELTLEGAYLSPETRQMLIRYSGLFVWRIEFKEVR
jgi:hypothetical protein